MVRRGRATLMQQDRMIEQCCNFSRQRFLKDTAAFTLEEGTGRREREKSYGFDPVRLEAKVQPQSTDEPRTHTASHGDGASTDGPPRAHTTSHGDGASRSRNAHAARSND
ncbi:unnamed protein product [Prorocentrum cordatum]|uniref:Uncharacterized protein n=1 Tax=Prorocentrum cordatum TaxID=2364126 RepID=A0ABN9U5U0_9DINO|nr:unnamed protein product [Polarella glacialis]